MCSSREEERACSRDTDGASCDSGGATPWGECGGFVGACGNTGSQTRTAYTCSAGECGNTESRSCSRNSNGTTCAAAGSWGSCGGWSNTCDETGSRSRNVYTCSSGACTSSAQTQNCARNRDGIACGECGACDDGDCVEGSTPQDRFEPNNSSEDATLIADNLSACASDPNITGVTIHSSSDDDWYRWNMRASLCENEPTFSVPNGYRLQLYLRCYVGRPDANLYVGDGDGPCFNWGTNGIGCFADNDILTTWAECPDQDDPEVMQIYLMVEKVPYGVCDLNTYTISYSI
ncbi:hypothetical protein HY477_04125 [Candidatus Uhrbacteria bacterium]|nr:hypothetical protein [Candidatus Uhrbacteria bacterium]